VTGHDLDSTAPVGFPAWLGSSTAVPSRRLAVAMLVTADAALFFDAALRWYHGFGFLHEARWLVAAGVMGALCVVSARLLTRRPSLAVTHALVALPLILFLFMTAGTDNGVFDWRKAWVVGRIFDPNPSWFDAVLQDRYETVASGVVVHTLFGSRYRHAMRRPSLGSAAATLSAAGLGLWILSWVHSAEFLMCFVHGEPHLPPDSLVRVRDTVWSVLSVLGLLVFGVASAWRLARASWLLLVATGRRPPFALRSGGDASTGSLPVLLRLPWFRRASFVLWRYADDGERPVARVIGWRRI
jgi:hypothetical protein